MYDNEWPKQQMTEASRGHIVEGLH